MRKTGKMLACALPLALLAACSSNGEMPPAATTQAATEAATTEAETEAQAEKTEGKFKPGEYSATNSGFGGDVTVTMKFDQDKITDVIITGDKETDGVGSKAVESLPSAILEAQSADVDGVSGATFTSKAILLSAQDCIDQAMGVSSSVTVKMKPGEYVDRASVSESVSLFQLRSRFRRIKSNP